jgi:NADH-quinone oxidoreductase subunit L
MNALLWLIVGLPLAAFAVLILPGRAMGARRSGILGTGAVMLSAAAAAVVSVRFLRTMPASGHFTAPAWQWFASGGLAVQFALRLDALSLAMVGVITVVASLILLYSVRYMAGEEEYCRFFAFMNLFVASMLLLVLADDLLVLYLGWEGVGLSSYLLIGFWYKDEGAVLAARKAFTVTRIGDTALLLGIVLIAMRLGTLRIDTVLAAAASTWQYGGALPLAAALLLLVGALGKSAQLPLQTWLPDAMAGPTPVSALIHAATMVTAGVYLIARMHGLFELAPVAMRLVAILGAGTLLLAGAAALGQSDIKRSLAYSTMSQIGYMFLALGAGAWTAAIFHFVTHAFFKALLFLAAGIVIHSLHGERDMHKMGGLRTRLPVTFAGFTIGVCSLAAIPLVTSGFYSKDLILSCVATSPAGGTLLWTCGIVGALLTALYSFRMLFLVFFGERKIEPAPEGGLPILLPIVILAAGSLTLGFLETPRGLGSVALFSNMVKDVLGAPASIPVSGLFRGAIVLFAVSATLIGFLGAWLIYLRKRSPIMSLSSVPLYRSARELANRGFGFDALYSAAVVRPFTWLANSNKADFTLVYPAIIARFAGAGALLLSLTQNGKLRLSVMGIALGAGLLIAIGIFS